ncbi:MAG: PAS domain-containing protein [Anaerolineae bacterium]|nr:PAS domain-containing protein [Anaerolineae bacterium]
MANFLSIRRSRTPYPLLPTYGGLATRQSSVLRYGLAIGAVGVALLISALFQSVFESAPFLLFWAAVVLSTWYGDLGPGLLSIVLSAAAVSLTFHDPAQHGGAALINVIQLAIFMLTTVSLSWLHERRRQAERWIVQQGRWFQTTLTGLGDGVIITDEVGRVLFLNPVASELTGWSISDAAGQAVDTIYRALNEPTREPLANPALRVLQHGQPVEVMPVLLAAKGGACLPVESSATPVRDEAGMVKGAVLVFHDISRRRQAETARQQSEAWLRAANEASLDGFMILKSVRDEKRRIVDFVWQYSNPAVHTIAGYPSDVLVGKRLLEVSPASARPDGPFEWCVSVAETGQPRTIERSVPGTDRWVRTDIIRVEDGVAVTLTDLTDVRRNEARLRVSEQRLLMAKNAAQLGIHDFNVPANVIEWDARTRELWGIGAHDSVNYDTFIRGVHDEDRTHVQAAVGAALDPAGDGDYHTEFRVENRLNGVTRWVEATGQAQFENGRAMRLVGTVQDITARKQAEMALEAERALLKALVDHLPMSVCLIRGSDLTVQMANAAYQALAPGKAMLGKTLDELWPEPGRRLDALCRRVLDTGEPHRAHDEHNTMRRTPDGPLEDIYFSWSLHRIRLPQENAWGLLNAAWETTDRKFVELALQKTEDMVRRQLAEIESIYDSAPIGLCALDAELRYLRINEQLAEMNGVPASAHLGRTLREVVPALADLTEASFRRVIETGEPNLNVELQGETPAQPGVIRTWIENWTPLRDGTGRIVGVNIVADEVTERMRNVQRLRQLRDLAVKLAAALTPSDVIQVLVNNGLQALGATAGLVAMLDEEGKALKAVEMFGYDDPPPERLRSIPLDDPDVGLAAAVRTEQPIWIESQDDAARFLALPVAEGDALARPTGAWACVPLRTNGHIVGGACLSFDGPHRFDDGERDFVLSVVDYCAQALGRVLLSEAAQKMAAAQEREHLARELHDAVSQSLFAASIIAESLRLQWQKTPEKVPDRLAQLHQLTRGALAEMRTLLLEMRPSALLASKMKALLTQLADAMHSRRPMDIQVEVDDWEPPIPELKISFYRIAQEALNNVVKHASATRVEVSLQVRDGTVEMRIVDNGKGFAPTAVSSSRMGMGIMHERALAVGAILDLQSEPGQGTRVSVRWQASE